MIRSGQNFFLYLTLALLYLPIPTLAQVTEAGEEHQSQQLGTAVKSNALQPGELKVTPHLLDNASNAENDYRSAVSFTRHGKNEGAEALLQHALSLQADHIAARELLVSLLVKRHNTYEAINVLEKGIIIVPNHSKFPLWLAQLHIKLDANEKALNILELNAIRFEQQPAYLGALAALYQQAGRQIEAHQYFLQATKLAPQDGRWWLGLGIMAEELKDWGEARLAYRRAKEYSFIEAPLLQFIEERTSIVDAQLQQLKG